MKGSMRCAALAWLLGLLPALAAAQSLPYPINPGDLQARLYLPARLAEDPALVVALHGCTQYATDYDDETGWTALAEEYGFVLLLPEQGRSNNPAGCFNWMRPQDRARGGGEAESIAQLVEGVSRRYGVAPGQAYVTGLSAGAAMSAVMLATYPELFAGGAILAGVPYGCVTATGSSGAALQALDCMQAGLDLDPAEWGRRVREAAPGHTGPWPRVSIWQGTGDSVVAPANAAELLQQWTDVHGIDTEADLEQSDPEQRHSRWVYTDPAGQPRVESWLISDMGHAVPVDEASGCGEDRISLFLFGVNDFVEDVGLCAGREILRFWGLAPLP